MLVQYYHFLPCLGGKLSQIGLHISTSLSIMDLQIVQVITHHHLLVCIPLIRSWASTRATWSLGKNIADSWPDAACRLALDYTYFKRIPTVFGCFWHVCFYSKSICKNNQRYILHVIAHLFYIFQIEPFCVFSRAMDSEYPRGYQHTKLPKKNISIYIYTYTNNIWIAMLSGHIHNLFLQFLWNKMEPCRN